MSFAVQLTAGSCIEFAENATLDAATKVYGAFSVKGDIFGSLNALTGAQEAVIDYVGKADKTDWKPFLSYLASSGAFAVHYPSGSTFSLITHTGLTLTGFDSATYYDCAWYCDPSLGTSAAFTVYAQGDLGGTVLAQWSTATTLPAITTAAGNGVRFLGNVPSLLSATVGGTYDWAKIGTDTTYAIENATLEEGTGTAVSPSGTITNSAGAAGSTPADYSWVSLTPADHGVVTLPTNPVAIGAGDTATVSWKDVNGNTITPQPATTWTVLGAGATINSSTGAYVGAAGGTATIKAQTGIVVATATLTITRRLSFTGTMTVT